MKIIHVVEPLAGGMVTFLKSLVENLPDDFHVIIHGERIQVTSVMEAKKQFDSPNVKFLRWRSAQRDLRFFKDIAAFFELFSILKRLKNNNCIDIVHLHSSKGGFLGRIACRLLNIQDVVVYTPNGAPFMAGKNFIINYLYKKLEKIANLFGGQVVCCSPSEQDAYKLAGIKAITINNGVKIEKLSPTYKKRKRSNVFRIVTSGRIEDQKNPLLFNKIAQYFEEFKQFEFIWVGDGTERNLLSSPNIKVTGWLTKQEANKVVSSGDIYLSTAHFEGLPFAVLEALSLKLPVLLSDCVGNKDLVMKGLNGDIFTNENEAINKLLQYYNNYNMLCVMGEHSGSHCRKSFDLFDTYQGYKQLYQKAAFSNNESPVRVNQLIWNKMKMVR